MAGWSAPSIASVRSPDHRRGAGQRCGSSSTDPRRAPRPLRCGSSSASEAAPGRATRRHPDTRHPGGGPDRHSAEPARQSEAGRTPFGADVVVDLDADGFVCQRPGRWELDTDTAMVGNYYDVAVLDQLELADGHDGRPGTTVEDLRVVDRDGSEAWEAGTPVEQAVHWRSQPRGHGLVEPASVAGCSDPVVGLDARQGSLVGCSVACSSTSRLRVTSRGERR